MSTSTTILERIRLAHNKDIDLGLRPAYRSLLKALGNPEQTIKNVVHVAGTNGKGSVCAFLRAITEACGKTANVYTSPHLIKFHERIRLGDRFISEDELAPLLQDIESHIENGEVSVFEAGTAAAFKAFANHPSDIAILEVGLGGRLDATNVVPEPIATVITRLSFDHRDYLGDRMKQIAREKAGILRHSIPCFTSPQPSLEALQALREETAAMKVPLFVGGDDWRIEAVDDSTFRFIGNQRTIESIPRPALLGTHQLWNAGVAIETAINTFPFEIPDHAIRIAMTKVVWPARMQKLTSGNLVDLLPPQWELWIDGGHNDSAGEVIGAYINRWHKDNKPVFMILGLLSSKNPKEFLEPILPHIDQAVTLRIDGEVPGYTAEELSSIITSMGIRHVTPKSSTKEALQYLTNNPVDSARILVCGSLYLAGSVLDENGVL